MQESKIEVKRLKTVMTRLYEEDLPKLKALQIKTKNYTTAQMLRYLIDKELKSKKVKVK